MMVILAVIQLMLESGQAITYGQVVASLAPCVPYLTGGGNPAPACWNGVKAIEGMASNTVDKRAACNCIKQAAIRYSSLKDDAAQALLTKCGVPMDIPVSWSTNCDL
ncbi:hypothetical protein NMG60_11023133 [Bertholletia excelsa]